VNRVPVADEGKRKQQKRNQQQPRRLRGINRVALVPVITIVLLLGIVRLGRHVNIVALLVWRSAVLVWGRAFWLCGNGHSCELALSEVEGFAERSSAGFLCNSCVAAPRCYTTASPMPVPQNNSRIARFGVFELDLTAGELRKNGRKLRLQEQPFQILALLLERAGDVVTREELRQKLWAADTFVDFDHGLNTAVNKLREVLGDSASTPRYIETLARRGYRFIAPLQKDVQPDAQQPASSSASTTQELGPVTMHPELEVPIPRRGLTRGLFALIQVMYLSFYLSALFRLHAIQNIADSFLPAWGATALAGAVMVTAGVGIPLRCYLISAVGFDHQRLDEKFRQMFLFLLALDQLWAVAPFLLMPKIGLGAAFATCAALLYLPFSERTLIRMAYLGVRLQG
jgi:cholera toxin transcriptional activator